VERRITGITALFIRMVGRVGRDDVRIGSEGGILNARFCFQVERKCLLIQGKLS
jgi:hypothetical protein